MSTENGEPRVRTGPINYDELLALLNGAFGGWGTAEFLQWKYDRYPGYDPSEHNFYIEIEGQLVAFRRVTEKHIAANGTDIPVIVFGDGAVTQDLRGQGLYSKLHTKTMDQYGDVGVVSTFNRVGSVTHKTNLNRGWKARVLPIHMRVLDYGNVIAEYATNVIEEDSIPHQFLEIVDRHLDFRTTHGTDLTLTSSENKTQTSILPAIPVPVTILQRTIAIAVRTSPTDAIADSIGNLGSSENGDSSGRLEPGTEYSIETVQEPSSATVEDVLPFFDADPPAFRRTKAEVEHLLAYPEADLVVVRRNGDLAGVSVVGPEYRPLTTEGRVLELQASDAKTRDLLFDVIEDLGHQRDYDTLVIAEHVNRKGWLRVDRQVFMWDPTTASEAAKEPLETGRLGMYDIV